MELAETDHLLDHISLRGFVLHHIIVILVVHAVDQEPRHLRVVKVELRSRPLQLTREEHLLDSGFFIRGHPIEPLQPVVTIAYLVLILFILLAFVLLRFLILLLLFNSLFLDHVRRLEQLLAIDTVVRHVRPRHVRRVLLDCCVLGCYFDELWVGPKEVSHLFK